MKGFRHGQKFKERYSFHYYIRSSVFIDFWNVNRVPVNFGEWGTADSAILDNAGKGGVTYVQDMLSLMKEHKLSWQFYYLNRLYKIDCCYDDNPTSVIKQELLDVFKSSLASPGE